MLAEKLGIHIKTLNSWRQYDKADVTMIKKLFPQFRIELTITDGINNKTNDAREPYVTEPLQQNSVVQKIGENLEQINDYLQLEIDRLRAENAKLQASILKMVEKFFDKLE